MKRLLWVGDAACDTGFSKCTHSILQGLRGRWAIGVLGMNYRGDPHPYPYPIYPAFVPARGADLFGVSRIIELCRAVKPDAVVFQNDPWNIPAYVERFEDWPKDTPKPRLVGAIAVDGKNCRGTSLNGLDHAIFWTAFGAAEAVQGGYTGSWSVIPLGVDTRLYAPTNEPKRDIRRKLGLPERAHDGASIWDGFFVLNVNRNQPRKRLDLTVRAFAAFYQRWKDTGGEGPTPFLYMHVCPTGDIGYDLEQLAAYHGLHQRIILAEPGVYRGSTEAEVIATYQAADLQINTAQGEGWGLTTMEGMACGVPQIAPDWSALGEWAKDAADLIPCTETCVTPNRINVIGGVPDHAVLVRELERLYYHAKSREWLSACGLQRAGEARYRWPAIAERYHEVLCTVVAPAAVSVLA